MQAAGLSPAQATQLAQARALPVQSLRSGGISAATRAAAVVALLLMFVMLTQYNTWTLVGVMEEKASRVIEVLLAAVAPAKLLGGKVLGIGLVVFAQAALVFGFAFALAHAVGSDLIHGTAPAVLLSALIWLVLGYALLQLGVRRRRLDDRTPGARAGPGLPARAAADLRLLDGDDDAGLGKSRRRSSRSSPTCRRPRRSRWSS